MTDYSLRAFVLGAAAGGGLPQWNCGCSNCTKARDPAHPLLPQTQSSLAVTADGENWAVLNASPDIRDQINQNPAFAPRAIRDTPVASVLVTNGDIDHIAGLLILREKQAFNLFLTREIAEILAQNPIFDALDRDFVSISEINLNEEFELASGLKAEIFAVPGKIPLFMEAKDKIPDTKLMGGQTVGVRLFSNGKTIFYIPGCASVNEELKSKITGADALFFDGTVFHDNELEQSGTGNKTGSRMGHIAMEGENGSLIQLADISCNQRIFVHINNTNPVWLPDSPERKKAEAAGWKIGHDGMEVAV